ncbi:uncharacterized protein LOC127869876 [Dreissena polymorpha]|uniref:uncharacterized protein LOC127869876 n=1 Tax=Dreissena polymorpha TaxID=45954 RepID=UPI0022646634|nr:uncharacterized protein LOC127869876 [Dreissena polymorpha]
MSTSQLIRMDINVVLGTLGCVHVVMSKGISITAPAFQQGTIVVRLNGTEITETSVLCASRIHPDVLYTHNDSVGKRRIFAISAVTGDIHMTIEIDGAYAQGWEGIACGPCNGTAGHCIADSGGNAGGDANNICKIREPDDDLTHATGVGTTTTAKRSR